jgi:hypothetical protein
MLWRTKKPKAVLAADERRLTQIKQKDKSSDFRPIRLDLRSSAAKTALGFLDQFGMRKRQMLEE